MATLTVTNHLTLDGVMQAPASAEEDTRDGFTLGGWAAPRADDPVMNRVMGEGMSRGGALLFGRRTYEKMASEWPHREDDNPFTEVLNNRQKYVVSTTLSEPLPWMNSTLLEGDAGEAVAGLKAQDEGSVSILGSGELLATLIPLGLVDEYVLPIHPVVLGAGRRLFPAGAEASLELVSAEPTTRGVVIARYRTVR